MSDDLLALFKTALIHDRSLLPEFLEDHGDYNTLRQLLTQLEDNYTPEQLFLGLVGPEYNKQLCIYELPTKELLTGINIICSLLEVTHIEEMMAGTALLSRLLNSWPTPLNIRATDGNLWIETSGHPYYPIQTKYVIDYINYARNPISHDSILYIISWMPQKCNEIVLLMKSRKPKQVLIIGEMVEHVIPHYKCIKLSLKQLCWKDYFKLQQYNQSIGNKINVSPFDSHSTVTLFIRTDDANEYDTLEDLLRIQLSESDCMAISAIPNNDDACCILDMVAMNILPKWILTLDEPERREIIILSQRDNSDNLSVFPTYIDNIDDYRFFAKLINANLYPKKIKTLARFNEFKQLYQQIDNNLETKYAFPNWIQNKEDRLKYIALDYSTYEKKWKQSYSEYSLTLVSLRSA